MSKITSLAIPFERMKKHQSGKANEKKILALITEDVSTTEKDMKFNFHN